MRNTRDRKGLSLKPCHEPALREKPLTESLKRYDGRDQNVKLRDAAADKQSQTSMTAQVTDPVSVAILWNGLDGYRKLSDLIGEFTKPTLYRRAALLRVAGAIRTRNGRFTTTDTGKEMLPASDTPESSKPKEDESAEIISLDRNALYQRWKENHELQR